MKIPPLSPTKKPTLLKRVSFRKRKSTVKIDEWEELGGVLPVMQKKGVGVSLAMVTDAFKRDFTPDTIDMLFRLFRQVDVDRDHKLCRDEMLEFLLLLHDEAGLAPPGHEKLKQDVVEAFAISDGSTTHRALDLNNVAKYVTATLYKTLIEGSKPKMSTSPKAATSPKSRAREMKRKSQVIPPQLELSVSSSIHDTPDTSTEGLWWGVGDVAVFIEGNRWHYSDKPEFVERDGRPASINENSMEWCAGETWSRTLEVPSHPLVVSTSEGVRVDTLTQAVCDNANCLREAIGILECHSEHTVEQVKNPFRKLIETKKSAPTRTASLSSFPSASSRARCAVGVKNGAHLFCSEWLHVVKGRCTAIDRAVARKGADLVSELLDNLQYPSCAGNPLKRLLNLAECCSELFGDNYPRFDSLQLLVIALVGMDPCEVDAVLGFTQKSAPGNVVPLISCVVEAFCSPAALQSWCCTLQLLMASTEEILPSETVKRSKQLQAVACYNNIPSHAMKWYRTLKVGGLLYSTGPIVGAWASGGLPKAVEADTTGQHVVLCVHQTRHSIPSLVHKERVILPAMSEYKVLEVQERPYGVEVKVMYIRNMVPRDTAQKVRGGADRVYRRLSQKVRMIDKTYVYSIRNGGEVIGGSLSNMRGVLTVHKVKGHTLSLRRKLGIKLLQALPASSHPSLSPALVRQAAICDTHVSPQTCDPAYLQTFSRTLAQEAIQFLQQVQQSTARMVSCLDGPDWWRMAQPLLHATFKQNHPLSAQLVAMLDKVPHSGNWSNAMEAVLKLDWKEEEAREALLRDGLARVGGACRTIKEKWAQANRIIGDNMEKSVLETYEDAREKVAADFVQMIVMLHTPETQQDTLRVMAELVSCLHDTGGVHSLRAHQAEVINEITYKFLDAPDPLPRTLRLYPKSFHRVPNPAFHHTAVTLSCNMTHVCMASGEGVQALVDIDNAGACVSPVECIVRNSRLSVLQVVLADGFDVSLEDIELPIVTASGNAAFNTAKGTDLLTLLLPARNCKRKTGLERALLEGSKKGLGRVIECLAAMGARSWVIDDSGNTVVHVMCSSRQLDVCEAAQSAIQTLAAGNPNPCDTDGHTPLHCAVLAELINTTTTLLALGADPALPATIYARNALHLAVLSPAFTSQETGLAAILTMATPQAVAMRETKHGSTAREMAAKNGLSNVVQLLEGTG